MSTRKERGLRGQATGQTGADLTGPDLTGADLTGPNRARAGLGEARALVHELRALREVEAPARLVPDVLAAVALGDQYVSLATPLGRVYVAYNAQGISAVARAGDAAAFEASFRARVGRSLAPAFTPEVAFVARLEAALRGERVPLRFDLRGVSEFERAVLLKALEIPRGEVRPYGWIAREIGRPRAVRAVGTALKRNPIPLFIPCHRVVQSDGHLGNYAMGGGEAKRRILAAETVDADALEQLARSGIRWYGSDTTHIYCFPTCRHARRVSAGHLMRFHSRAEAEEAGYRPCSACRPA